MVPNAVREQSVKLLPVEDSRAFLHVAAILQLESVSRREQAYAGAAVKFQLLPMRSATEFPARRS